jgi:hypothetical protein
MNRAGSFASGGLFSVCPSFEGNVIARSEERTTKQSLYFQEIASLLLVARNDEGILIWLVSGQTLFILNPEFRKPGGFTRYRISSGSPEQHQFLDR